MHSGLAILNSSHLKITLLKFIFTLYFLLIVFLAHNLLILSFFFGLESKMKEPYNVPIQVVLDNPLKRIAEWQKMDKDGLVEELWRENSSC